MAELTSFGYSAGDSLLHRMDARVKIISIILLSLVNLNVNFRGLGLLTIILLGVIIYARLPLASGFKELRYFLILLILIFITRVLSTDGIQVISLKYFTISMQGITNGIRVCWRLALIVILGFAFISTTPPSAIKAAVQWFLKPVPFIPEKKVAVMMGLILRFVPVILDQARETAEAQKARAVENRKNPVYRLTKFGFPLIRRTFERADDLVVAMEARAFSEHRTDPELNADQQDWICLLVVCCLCVSLIMV
ncbi:MAG: energy-coupling factor transporter transmembrane protein EcfT [bacterium]|nr:energy-coupling factor transporter transmembrane protein EcfT [bacterium]